jgi:CRP/FNR family transcriptional regulator, cyclic AMP receptor protein
LSNAAAGYADLLNRCILFQPLTQADREELAAKAVYRRYKAGQPIFRVGDPGDSLMAVAAGTVRISMASTNGRQIILADLPAGDVFGEVALLDGLGRSADATALTATELLIVERSALLRFLTEHPDASLRMLALVCSRLRASDERMSDIASVELGARLAKALLRRAPTETASNNRPRISLSQGDLASMISSSREAVNRQLADWQRSGLVEVLDGAIVVNRQTELAVIAGLV